MSYVNPTATELALLGHARTTEQARLKLAEAMRLFGARDEWPTLDDVVGDAVRRLTSMSEMKRELHNILRTRNHESLLARADEVMDVLPIVERALEDLGACDDEACAEPNCLHALVVVRRALRREETR